MLLGFSLIGLFLLPYSAPIVLLHSLRIHAHMHELHVLPGCIKASKSISKFNFGVNVIMQLTTLLLRASDSFESSKHATTYDTRPLHSYSEEPKIESLLET